VSTQPIRQVGNPALRRTAAPVTVFDGELVKLVKDLTDTLRATGAAGLAAPQIGVGLRLFAVNPHLPGNDDRLDHLINPVLEFPEDEEQTGPEACLSIPGIQLDTKRRRTVVATGLTRHGDPVRVVARGPLARCVQHETDHLDGVLFVDRQDAGGINLLLDTVREANWGSDRIRVSPR
jgi:peptide deformylase